MSLNVFATALVVPPLDLLPLTLGGLALRRRFPRAGNAAAWAGALLLLLLSLPAVGGTLRTALEIGLPLRPPAGDPPRAIVILSAELERTAGSPPRYQPGPLTLERLRAGALLHRRTGLPILLSGGVMATRRPPLAAVMARVLEQDYAIRPRWLEQRSRSTWQNARDSARILARHSIRSIYLVTHAWHMRRALIAFRHFGITATAAPVRLDPFPRGVPAQFAPRLKGWTESYDAFHEAIGCLYYLLRAHDPFA